MHWLAELKQRRRPYLYTVVNGSTVLVEPRSRRIVPVIA
jgi:hypothetical protein